MVTESNVGARILMVDDVEGNPRQLFGAHHDVVAGQMQPLAATLNDTDGAVTNNMAIVPATTGSVSVIPLAPTHLVLDIFGYFAP